MPRSPFLFGLGSALGRHHYYLPPSFPSTLPFTLNQKQTSGASVLIICVKIGLQATPLPPSFLAGNGYGLRGRGIAVALFPSSMPSPSAGEASFPVLPLSCRRLFLKIGPFEFFRDKKLFPKQAPPLRSKVWCDGLKVRRLLPPPIVYCQLGQKFHRPPPF